MRRSREVPHKAGAGTNPQKAAHTQRIKPHSHIYFAFKAFNSGKILSPKIFTIPAKPRLKMAVNNAVRVSVGISRIIRITEETLFAFSSVIVKSTIRSTPKNRKLTNPTPNARPGIWVMTRWVFEISFANNAPMTRKYATRAMVSRMPIKNMRRMSVMCDLLVLV